MTHSYNHLFEQLISYDNIKTAIFNAAKRKRKRNDVRYILANIEEHITKIIYMLENGEFKPQVHSLRRIYDGVNRKERFITQPYFFRNAFGEAVYEQIVHHAVIQVLKPVFMKSMYFHSNGSIPDRGCHRGKKYLAKFIKEHKNSKDIKYYAQADIRHFYQSVNTGILKDKLRKIIHDEKFLQVVFTIIDSNLVIWEGKKERTGLPIGFYPSQWFANFYLTELDHKIKEEFKVPFYTRYMDDMVFIGGNKKCLTSLIDKVSDELKHLGLKLKPNHRIELFDYEKNGKVTGKPIDVMGFKFYRNRVVLRKHILSKSMKAARKVHETIKNNKFNWYVASRLMSYLGWYKHTNTYNFFKKNILPYAHIHACRKIIRQHSRRDLWLTKTRRADLQSRLLFREKGLRNYFNRRKRNDIRTNLENIRVSEQTRTCR